MRILTVDTATRRGTVSAVQGDYVLAFAAHDRPMTHAERLFGMVDEVLASAGWTASQVDLLAVGKGPGSFTGVRVGMAAAKGIAFALRIPLVGVVSLAAMAHAGRPSAGGLPVVAMIDAKKGEIFVACYSASGETLAGPDHIPRENVDTWISGLGVARTGLCVVGEVAGELALPNVQWFRDTGCDLPGPASTARLAQASWETDHDDEIDTLEPLYVRPPDITLPASLTSNSTGRSNSA